MRLTIVIPAYNEAKRIGECLESVHAALRAVARPDFESELLVVDNNSKDETAEIAGRAGAKVIFESHNQIARARNTGGRAASGDWILFLDADTLVFPETVVDLLKELDRPEIVGGTSVLNYGKGAFRVRFFVGLCNFIIRRFKMTAGCFVFCRAEAFGEIGGFNEEYYAGEDAEFGKALKRWGRARGQRLAILEGNPPLTSDRKFHLYGLCQILLAVGRYVLFPQRTMRDKRHLGMFYDGKR